MRVAVVGAGGHAKVILALIEARGDVVEGVYDGDAQKVGTLILGHAVRAMNVRAMQELATAGRGVSVVLALGNNATRQRVAAELGPCSFATLVHPHAWVAPTVKLGAGTVVFAGAVVQPDTVVGDHVIVNTAASIDHDCGIGDFVHIAPGSHLAGNVVVGDGAFLGVGVSVIPGCSIGRFATVGAGAVVVTDIAANVVVKGVPAR